MKTRFDLDDEIMNCWRVVEDIKQLYEYFGDSPDFKDMPPELSDKIGCLMLGLYRMYDVKFNKLFETFEEVSPSWPEKCTLSPNECPLKMKVIAEAGGTYG